MEVEPVVKLGKFKHYLDGFWLVSSREASMLFTLEYPLAALVDQVWTNRIESVVEFFVPTFLLWKQHNCSEGWLLARCHITAFLHSFLDVSPYVRSIVSVEVNYSFGQVNCWLGTCGCKNGSITLFLALNFRSTDFWLWNAMAGYLIQVSGVCLRSDDINNFMERSIRVLLSISSSDVTKNTVVRNFGEIHLWEVVFSSQPRL